MLTEKSCGAVVFTRQNGEIKYLLIRSVEGFYGFPKGHMEANETEEETALREIFEETGLKVSLFPIFKTAEEHPFTRKDGVPALKKVTYFLAEYADQTPVRQESEVESLELFDYSAAMEKIEFESNRRVLSDANEFLTTYIAAEKLEEERKKSPKKPIDCGFTEGNNWFRYRAAAIIVEKGCVLLVSNARESYYYSVGGGVHMGETAKEAVMREVFEETGVHYCVDKLAVIHENFFSETSGSLKGLTCHEVTFYFLMKPRGTMELDSNSYTSGIREHMNWIPIQDLHRYRAYPTFLRDYLTNEHDGIEHIVTNEN